jgi:cystine transport system permease protein
MTERLWNVLTESFLKILIPGLKITIPLTVISVAIGLVLAMLLAVVQVADIKVLKQISKLYIWVFRGTPLLVQLVIVFFGLPKIGIIIPAFPCAVIAFSLNVAAYNAEAIRAAMLAVPKGQIEAAYLIGMTYPQILFRIIIPQAFPVSFPSLFHNLISLVKDTSLASSISIIELFAAAQREAARTFESFGLYIEAAMIYLLFCTVLTWLQQIIEKHMGWKTKPGRLAALQLRIKEAEAENA